MIYDLLKCPSLGMCVDIYIYNVVLMETGALFSKLFVDNPQDGIVVKLVVSLLQLSKMAVNQTGEREVLGND